VHTSAKARLTSAAIWRISRSSRFMSVSHFPYLPIRKTIPASRECPDRHGNLIVCSVANRQPSLKISCKSVQKFLRKVANKQTYKQQQLHNLLGESNNNSKGTSYCLQIYLSTNKSTLPKFYFGKMFKNCTAKVIANTNTSARLCV